MNLPLSWLKQFVDVKATPEQLAEKLTLSGSEVEKITRQDSGISKVVVGQIKEIKPHPNADKLKLAYVDIGKGWPLEIVCGADNIAVGQKVPCVLLGGSVPGLKIEPREIRGVKSHGMLASASELGIGDDHSAFAKATADKSGIFILPQDSKIGADVVKLLELDEPVLELDITPNRPDCFSVRGLAREAGALFGEKLRVASFKLQESRQTASSVISVKVEDNKLCPKYCARIIKDVKVGPSPLWLANQLRQMGVKSINNVVDVTNYVMLELGQPLHAFDYDRLYPESLKPPSNSPLEGGRIRKNTPLEGGRTGDSSPYQGEVGWGFGEREVKKIVIRRAKKGEKIVALDDETYKLDESMLVIADTAEPLAIAGIMGGKASGVSDQTSTIVLEAAIFEPAAIRRTAKALALRSESSSRFEKGVDASAVEEAIDRAAKMIADLSGGTPPLNPPLSKGGRIGGIISSGTNKPAERKLKLSLNEVERILGVEVAPAKVKSILMSLGFVVSPPLGRLRRPKAPPSSQRRTQQKGGEKKKFPLAASEGAGGGTAFTKKTKLIIQVPTWRLHDIFQTTDLVEEIGRLLDYNTLPKTLPVSRVASPQPEPLHKLRRDLRDWLVGAGYREILTYSFYGEPGVKLSGYDKKDHILLTNPVNKEYPYLRASLAPWLLEKLSQNSSLLSNDAFRLFEIGKVFSARGGLTESWKAALGLINTKASDEELYRELRGIIESFIGKELAPDKKGEWLILRDKNKDLAAIKIFNKDSQTGLRFRSSSAIAQIDFNRLLAARSAAKTAYAPISSYPVVERDLSLIVPNGVEYAKIEKESQAVGNLLKSAKLVDVYHGLKEGTSLTFRLTFGSAERTLESKEVDEAMGELQKNLLNKYKVTFR